MFPAAENVLRTFSSDNVHFRECLLFFTVTTKWLKLRHLEIHTPTKTHTHEHTPNTQHPASSRTLVLLPSTNEESTPRDRVKANLYYALVYLILFDITVLVSIYFILKKMFSFKKYIFNCARK